MPSKFVNATLEHPVSRVPARSPRSEATPLIGEIVEASSTEFPGRTRVRWRSADNAVHEQWLRTVAGLSLMPQTTVLLQKPANVSEWLVTAALAPETPLVETKSFATIDGQRIVLNGKDEIVLQCGQASITLRRNGRVVIRGAYVESRSRGTNRIKGGSVLIN